MMSSIAAEIDHFIDTTWAGNTSLYFLCATQPHVNQSNENL